MTESHSTPSRPNPLRPVIFVFVIFLAVGAVVAFSKLYVPKELVPWRHDFAAAQAESKRANKPLLAYFTAEWCGPCQYMRREVWTDKSVAAALDPFVPVKIDVDQQPALAQQYVGSTLPTFIVMTPDGHMLKQADHGFETNEFIDWLKGS